ncbi:MAG: hypothetical protein IH840_06790 [Candidatus Heimdallarchaeota archaeon]|nr:hypothetical protein [Candidatus Heimdallarchaeota archaeon]
MTERPKITVLTVGTEAPEVLESLLESDAIDLSIVCFNLLDYELPPKVENAASQHYRDELQNALKIISPANYSLSDSLKNLLMENDRLTLSEEDLAIVNHVNQIEQNSQNLVMAYQILLEETKRQNISLIPLVDDEFQILAFKNKKYAPLRFYATQNELLKENPPPPPDKTKRKYDEKKLTIENLDDLETVKLGEKGKKAIQESDLIVIYPSDITSFGILVKAKELEKQIKKISTKIVLIWPFEVNRVASEVEHEIAETLNFGSTLDDLGKDIADLTDYIIIDKSDKEHVDNLREVGCHVLVSDLSENGDTKNPHLLETIFSVGNFNDLLDRDKSEVVATSSTEVTKSTNEGTGESNTPEQDIVLKKTISQLAESPEEAGEGKSAKKSSHVKDPLLEEILADPEESTSVQGTTTREVIVKDKKETNKLDRKPTSALSKSDDSSFGKLEEEDWVDAVKRGIESIFTHKNAPALEWLIAESKEDSDKEVQIAQTLLSNWISARTIKARRTGAETIFKLSEVGRETYLQVLTKQMLSAVFDGQEDVRRRLIQNLSVLTEIGPSLSEQLIRGLARQLSNPSDATPAIVEIAKLTIIQLVINSRKLSRVAIQVFLDILDKEPGSSAQIWNILTTFDAGSVAIELVTNFSIDKAEEIVRRANFLKLTGSVYTIITEVLNAWETGDKDAIAQSTGLILPEETLRKFDRLELARKVQKLKMVQLSALAESLGKDTETVERLVTELIVNDELKAEIKLIEEKMYIVAEENPNS